MTAEDIIKLLAAKHADDIFVPQCKTGPSVTGLGILDAWTMNRSWAHMNMIGYEVKVSRQDFLKDTKWRNYLPYCNSFYFVAPEKIIDPKELPDEAGLLTVARTGTLLFTKKKAPHRKIDNGLVLELMAYIMMNRVRVKQEDQYNGLEYWGIWLAEKEYSGLLGSHVSKTMRERYDKHVVKVELENEELKRRNDLLDRVSKALDVLGIPVHEINQWNVADSVRSHIVKLYKPEPPHYTIREIQKIQHAVDELKRHLNLETDKT